MYRNRTKPSLARSAKLFCSLLIAVMLWLGDIDVAAHNPHSDSPYRDWPAIASIERVGNNADESTEFTLDACTAMRLYAVGEGSRSGMDDYGSIERADTGQVVWQMYHFETDPDGWSINRRVERRLTLPAGAYRLRFRSNGSHSFDDWGRRPPEHRFWGIALYQDRSADSDPPACWETDAEQKNFVGL